MTQGSIMVILFRRLIAKMAADRDGAPAELCWRSGDWLSSDGHRADAPIIKTSNNQPSNGSKEQTS
jgi:hypothetical protein